MTLLPGLLVVLVAGCHAQETLRFPANTYALPQQPLLHYVPVVPYYQPIRQPQPQMYTTVVESSGMKSPLESIRSFSVKRLQLDKKSL